MGEVFGFLSAVCFGVCAVPQAWACLKTKTAKGINAWFLGLWFVGELFAFAYAVIVLNSPFWLMVNYTFNTLFLLPIIYFKIKDCK